MSESSEKFVLALLTNIDRDPSQDLLAFETYWGDRKRGDFFTVLCTVIHPNFQIKYLSLDIQLGFKYYHVLDNDIIFDALWWVKKHWDLKKWLPNGGDINYQLNTNSFNVNAFLVYCREYKLSLGIISIEDNNDNISQLDLTDLLFQGIVINVFMTPLTCICYEPNSTLRFLSIFRKTSCEHDYQFLDMLPDLEEVSIRGVQPQIIPYLARLKHLKGIDLVGIIRGVDIKDLGPMDKYKFYRSSYSKIN